MTARKVRVELTARQARELRAAARYKLEQDPDGDGVEGQDRLVLERTLGALDTAIDEAEAGRLS